MANWKIKWGAWWETKNECVGITSSNELNTKKNGSDLRKSDIRLMIRLFSLMITPPITSHK